MKKQYLPLAILLSSSLLIACQDGEINEATVETADATTQTTAQPEQINNTPPVKDPQHALTAEEVTFEAVKYEYEIPSKVANVCTDEWEMDSIGCPSIDIELAKVQPKWIEQAINLSITDDNSPKLAKFNQDLDEFALIQLSDKSSMGYGLSASPKMVGTHNNVAQFSVMKDTFLGGAHGMPTIDYLLFDMDLQSQIDLYDVINDSNGIFFDLAYDAYKDYLKSIEVITPQEVADYEKTWPFEIPEEFYFDKYGLVLVAQPYQLGSFSQGFVEVTVPYQDLEGVLKPQYMP